MEAQAAPKTTESRKLLLIAVMVTVIVRLYLLSQYYCISSDGVLYIDAAKDFYAGDFSAGLSSVYPPGYPLLIATVFPLIGEWELAGQVLSLLFGVLLLWPLYLLFRDVYDERIAGIACILAALSPFLARYAVHVRTESPFIFFSTFALLLFYQGVQKRRLGRFLWGGLVAGFAYLVRPEALGFLIIVPTFLGLLWLTKKEFQLAWIVKSTAILAIAFMLFAMPYIIYLSVDTGQWGAVSRKAGVTLGISLQESGLLETDGGQNATSAESVEFVEFIRRHPLRFLTKVVASILPAIGVFLEVLHYSYVPFLLAGLYLIFREKFWQRKDFLILLFVFFYIFAFMLIYVKRRYSLQVVPVSLGWVAIGMIWAWHGLPKLVSAKLGRVIAVVLALAFLGGTLPKTLTPISREKAYVREAGWYLRGSNPSGNLKVAAWDDRIGFYAHAKTTSLAGIEESGLPGQLREHKVNYLAADAEAWQKWYPTIAARPEAYGLVLEREFIGTRKARLLVFKVI